MEENFIALNLNQSHKKENFISFDQNRSENAQHEDVSRPVVVGRSLSTFSHFILLSEMEDILSHAILIPQRW